MIHKIVATLAVDPLVSIAFIFSAWGLVGMYHIGEWWWSAFFATFLLFYIYKLAFISVRYDTEKRKGNLP